MEWGDLSKSEAAVGQRYKVDGEEPCFLTQEEGRRLVNAAHGQMKTFVCIALHTGLRKAELFRLKWEDISRDELRVRKAKGRRADR